MDMIEDIIYTDAKRIDVGVIRNPVLDLSFGKAENNFELQIPKGAETLDFSAMIYSQNSEYGGIVDGISSSTTDDIVKYFGRTWHGILNSKVITPDTGAAYLVVSGEANQVLGWIINRLGLSDLFAVSTISSGMQIQYQFPRYVKAYDAVCAMLQSVGAKLRMEWVDQKICLSADRITDYSGAEEDEDSANLTVKKTENKVNHLICLGRGELENREIIHLYADAFGNIGKTPYYTGLQDITEIYDYSSVESIEQLESEGIKKLKELREIDTAEISAAPDASYDIGDIAGGVEYMSGISSTARVTQKIVKINGENISTEYKIGG